MITSVIVWSQVRRHGEHSVKNIARPVRVSKVLFDANYEPLLVAMKPSEELNNDVTLGSEDDLTEVAFWEPIREDNDGTELRLYLERYPEGAFSDLALARLDRDLTPAEDPAVEVSFWESVRASENVAMIQAYLQRYPAGKFVSLAKILVDQKSSDGTL